MGCGLWELLRTLFYQYTRTLSTHLMVGFYPWLHARDVEPLNHMSCVAKYRTKLVKMDLTLEHKIHEIREEVTTLRAAMDRLTAMVKSLMAARNQSPTPPSPRSGATEGLRSILTLLENKFREGLGYSSTYASVVTQDTVVRPIQEFFRSACFINPPQPGVDAILEDDLKEDSPNFVTHEEDYVNMVYGCPGKYRIFDAHLMRGDLRLSRMLRGEERPSIPTGFKVIAVAMRFIQIPNDLVLSFVALFQFSNTGDIRKIIPR
ncbi:hypothetical protein L195_g034441 [Trifolium pratense]|uniref:Uncharacterized protein n=2 Tax=Trifolium pratense TaxID=57577 RepID=A0A2K3LIW3_TRIPR|nr:hypothetical protein L195_g034441 [Trifolium pratense]